MSIEIIFTADGSHSLRNVSLDETYHSVHGAIQESVHVFIKNGLLPVMSRQKEIISVLEIGFGTALNALLTLQQAGQRRQKVHYTAIDPYPLTQNIWSALNYPVVLDLAEEFQLLHRSKWHIATPLSTHFELLKEEITLQEAKLIASQFDLVYFDAFAPSKQPELWETTVLAKVVASLKPGGVFVTYCAKGQLKRDLKSLGLQVETLPGPPGKKEMIRAIKSELSSL